jgi:hypothetical protein
MIRITLGVTALLSGALLVACGSSTSDTPTPTAAANNNISTSAPATSAPAPTTAAAASAADVSGGWSGHYSGVYNGTFTLTWQQTGSTVNGQIVLSSPAHTFSINGNLAGNAITFGAVGAVTYTGTVSGSSMSGTYQVPGGGGGNWSASKS